MYGRSGVLRRRVSTQPIRIPVSVHPDFTTTTVASSPINFPIPATDSTSNGNWSVPLDVLMTGSGSERVAVAALKAGAADYVPKQALAHDLVPVLERILRKHALALREPEREQHTPRDEDHGSRHLDQPRQPAPVPGS